MTWKRFAAVLPGVGASLLPKLTCPLCWPAYAGLLTTLGLGFLMSERYLFGVTLQIMWRKALHAIWRKTLHGKWRTSRAWANWLVF